MITIRTTGFAQAEAQGGSASVTPISGPGDAGLSSFVSAQVATSLHLSKVLQVFSVHH